jgi:RNA polymerase sigma-70 factor, ECF subfamily
MAFSIDKSTLEKASRCDGAALTTMISALQPHIEKQLLRYPLSDEDRRDLVQSTLMQIIRRVGSFRGDSSFSTWLFRVTANEALMMMRS